MTTSPTKTPENKLVSKYAELDGTVTIVDLEKGQTGLGLSLAGNRDRKKMSVFVCGLHPQGSAFKDGRIKVGDEILEVRRTRFNDRTMSDLRRTKKGFFLARDLLNCVLFS